ncbi:DUF3011 domain-containing protein [Sphingopyxis sp.]|uniref:DUF3011 domain-containing protein n=1 Tax=Sphingopyxis sp. TaxID=1908224 RepID=UPI003BA85304
MRNPVVTTITTVSLIASQLATPVFAQVTTLPYPGSGGPQIQPPRPVEPVPVPPTPPRPGGPQIQPPRPDYGNGATIRCESRNQQYQRCNVQTGYRVELLRTLGGRCSQGATWGYAVDHIWVNNGCRGEFRYGNSGGGYPTPLPQPVQDYAGTIRCESRGNRYEQCNVATNSRVELVQRIGGKCNAGRQWGYTADYIWVDKGCRADFGYGYWDARPPEKEKDKGPSTGLIIGGVVVAGGLLALLLSKKKKSATGEETAVEAPATYPAGPPATLSANLSSLPSAARPSVQNCMTDAARQIGVTGGTRLSYDKLVSLEQGNGGWRIRAAMTATYPDGARSIEMYCRATPSDIIQLDFS